MVATRSSSSRSLADKTLTTRRSKASLRSMGAAPGQTEEDLVRAIARKAEQDALKERGMNGIVGRPRRGQPEEYEFGGPFGAFGIIVAVVFFAYFLQISCGPKGCPPWPLDPSALRKPAFWRRLWDTKAAAVYFAHYVFVALSTIVLPGKRVKGNPLRTGERLDYKFNAMPVLLASLALVAFVTGRFGLRPLVYVADHTTQFVTAALINALAQSIFSYAVSFRPGVVHAVGGDTENSFFNWFIGRTLNPRIGSFDIKTFNEIYPGLTLWGILNLSYMAKQYVSYGEVTDSMWLVVLFQGWYIVDTYLNDTGILSQMDIITDGFGFMLAVGDLAWLPFVYSVQARYLAYSPKPLGFPLSALIVAVELVGAYIFRVSNVEKNDLRNGKNPKNLTTMATKRGTKLLTSGWWGWSRHPNYLGDWIMAVAWSLPTGFDTLLPYFYPVYFAVLLIHRQRRDDAACAQKYGDDWKRYVTLVPYRIIPGVY